MFAGWGDEAKPVCVLKSLQLAGLQMGSSTVGDAWLFLLLVLQAPPQILNEEIVVLWTRIHGEMSYYKDTVKVSTVESAEAWHSSAWAYPERTSWSGPRELR